MFQAAELVEKRKKIEGGTANTVQQYKKVERSLMFKELSGYHLVSPHFLDIFLKKIIETEVIYSFFIIKFSKKLTLKTIDI